MKKNTGHILRPKESYNAVSEVVGTVLMLGIAVAIFAILYFIVISQPLETTEPTPRIIATVEGDNIILEHRGGYELNSDAKITINLGYGPETSTVGELLIDTNGNNKWDIGEKLAYPFTYSLDISEADVIGVNVEGKEVFLRGTLNIQPVTDIGIEITVDNQYPKVGEKVNITITITHYRGDMNASGIIVKYILPDGLEYKNHITTQGIYNINTGYWTLGNEIRVRGSAILTINANVTAIGFLSEFTSALK